MERADIVILASHPTTTEGATMTERETETIDAIGIMVGDFILDDESGTTLEVLKVDDTTEPGWVTVHIASEDRAGGTATYKNDETLEILL